MLGMCFWVISAVLPGVLLGFSLFVVQGIFPLTLYLSITEGSPFAFMLCVGGTEKVAELRGEREQGRCSWQVN